MAVGVWMFNEVKYGIIEDLMALQCNDRKKKHL